MMFAIIRRNADDDGNAAGQHFITQAEADELRAMTKDAGRQEGAFLSRLFGDQVRSFEELQPGPGYQAARSTLAGIIQQRAARKTKTEG
jgi:hypothetical protein